ncbi:MAG: tetratricopeptide repeat protein [Pseudomonadota bacterium]
MRTLTQPLARLPAAIALACLLASPASYAIEIEQRPLSSNTPAPTSAPAPVAAPVARPVAVAPAPATIAAPVRIAAPVANPAWDMFQQIEEMRMTVARLQGTVEEQQQLIERLQSDLRTRYTDLDQRLEQLAKPAVVSEPAPVLPVATAPAADVTAAPASNTVIPAKVKADLSPEEIERQKAAYLAAYQTFRRDGAAPAITAMTSFLDTYPDSVFSPNAYYWLGEFQLALTPANYAKAEASFQRVLRDYSASPKVASAYYKLGSIADLQGNRKEARDWMSKLIAQYSSSPEARLAQSFLDQNPAK